jgi:hypothetical protein
MPIMNCLSPPSRLDVENIALLLTPSELVRYVGRTPKFGEKMCVSVTPRVTDLDQSSLDAAFEVGVDEAKCDAGLERNPPCVSNELDRPRCARSHSLQQTSYPFLFDRGRS